MESPFSGRTPSDPPEPVHNFFGLRPSDKAELLWEPEFLLQYYLGVTSYDYYHTSVAKKRWMIERVVKELNKTNDKGESPPTKALHQNDPQTRELMGMQRAQTPSRLRRFT